MISLYVLKAQNIWSIAVITLFDVRKYETIET